MLLKPNDSKSDFLNLDKQIQALHVTYHICYILCHAYCHEIIEAKPVAGNFLWHFDVNLCKLGKYFVSFNLSSFEALFLKSTKNKPKKLLLHCLPPQGFVAAVGTFVAKTVHGKHNVFQKNALDV